MTLISELNRSIDALESLLKELEPYRIPTTKKVNWEKIVDKALLTPEELELKTKLEGLRKKIKPMDRKITLEQIKSYNPKKVVKRF